MDILGFAKKLRDQVNPFDGGKTWSNPTGSRRTQGNNFADKATRAVSSTVNPRNSQSFFNQNISAPIRRGITGAVEAVNPFDAESKGNKLLDRTKESYGFTPEFKGILDMTNPYVNKGDWQNSLGLRSVKAGGSYYPKEGYSAMNSRMRISPGRDEQDTLLHEGLHSAWDTDERYPSDFGFAYNKQVDRGLTKYLAKRTQPYKSADGLRPRNFRDIRTVPHDLQTEVHSFVPEYYASSGRDMPPALAKYYSQFYDPNKYRSATRQQASNDQVAENILDILNSSWRKY